jgi:hypothetical protein
LSVYGELNEDTPKTITSKLLIDLKNVTITPDANESENELIVTIVTIISSLDREEANSNKNRFNSPQL